MRPRIALPLAHSTDLEYSHRVAPQYEEAVRLAGGEPVRIPLAASNHEIMAVATTCDAVLLPGSRADVNPEKYGASERHPLTAPSDPARDNADELLIQDAYNMRKPILAICFGMQILNVWRTGTLIQHLETDVQHNGPNAPSHSVTVEPGSLLASMVADHLGNDNTLVVNTSHHQAVEIPGDGLRVVARAQDVARTIEAVEGASSSHFVLGVQWHPERMTADPAAAAIFSSFVEAARSWHARQLADFETLSR